MIEDWKKLIENMNGGVKSLRQDAPNVMCSVPCDYVPKRSYPLFRARGVLEVLVAGRDAGSPEGDRSPAPRRARPRP